MEQKSSQNDTQIGAKIGAWRAPRKKPKLDAQNVEILRKYVDFSDLKPPQKGPKKATQHDLHLFE